MPDSLSATEQSTLNRSPVSNITLPPDKISSELPFGIFTSLTKNEVPLFAALPPPDVVLTNSTSAVTADEWILANTNPITTVVVLPGTVYIVYGDPAEFGSAAKVTTLNVFASIYLLFTYILYRYF